MAIRFLLFVVLLVSAAASWAVLAAITASSLLDPPKLFADDYVHGAIFAGVALPMLLIAYPFHRRYVYDWEDWSVGNLVAYLFVCFLLLAAVFGGYFHAITTGHATALGALPLYIVASVFALWLGGWLTVAR